MSADAATGEELAAIARHIWDLKYRLKSRDGQPLEADVSATFRRVARAAAQAEAPELRDHWEGEFFRAMDGFAFLPAGRILAGAGTGRAVTLFNCFVMGEIPDSLDGIFTHLKEAALTLQQGGGIGYDFSSLRPKGAAVEGVGADASGPLSFMDVWDAMCRTIMSAGARRGAMMACLACDHPDIEDFVDAKAEAGRLRNFNLSVLVSDAFMAAVAAGASWPLVFAGRTYKTVPARALWDRILKATYAYAEPGVIFIDRINAENNLAYCETISATNPCGEQPLPPYGACLLGSINLARLVDDPFTDKARLDEDRLAALARLGVRFLDNVIDISRFPLAAQAHEASAKRRLGLGVTGLADALLMLGIRYGSGAAAGLTGRWLAAIESAAYLASCDLAAQKGVFPLFEREAFLAGPRAQRLPGPVRAAIAAKGLRNGLLTSIAPTGTISLFAGNVSSGIEPIFAERYVRRLLLPDGTHSEETVEDYALALLRRLKGAGAPLPSAFVSAQTLSVGDHLAIQAAAQRHVDAAISKTINCPQDLSFEAFKSVYGEAHALGLKGCTTFRANAITGSILKSQSPAEQGESAQGTAKADEATSPTRPRSADVVYMSQPLERPETLPGLTYKIRWPASDHALYITLNDILQDGRRRPFEIFINSKNMEHYAWTVALTRMISAVFRRGGDVSFVVEELKAVFDPQGGHWMKGRYVPSLLAAIGGVIEDHLGAIGFHQAAGEIVALPLRREAAADGGAESADAPGGSSGPPGRICPRCAQPSLVQQEGCLTCLSCGYSKCG